MIKLYQLLFLLCCTLSISTPIFAQETDNINNKTVAKPQTDAQFKEELKAEIMAELKAELLLDKKKIKEVTTNKQSDGTLSLMPKFSGYVQAGYIWHDNNGDKTSTFKVNRLRLIVTGNISKTFDYTIQAEAFSNSVDGNKKALISILDMIVRAKLSPAFNIQVGQMPIPLSMEIGIAPGLLETVGFSSVLSKLVCTNAVTGVTNYGRDAGIMVSGSLFAKDGFSLLNYDLGVFNGSQANQTDNDSAKDIAARLTVQPCKELKISGSFNWGEYVMPKNSRYASLTRYAAGAYYQGESLMIRSEYGYQYSAKASVKQEMYYIVAGYNIAGKVMPILKYDVFNDKNVVDSKHNNYLFGVAYTPISRLKVQANYTITKYQHPTLDLGNKFELMVVGFF